MRIQS